MMTSRFDLPASTLVNLTALRARLRVIDAAQDARLKAILAPPAPKRQRPNLRWASPSAAPKVYNLPALIDYQGLAPLWVSMGTEAA
jgi:hypothetical protein